MRAAVFHEAHQPMTIGTLEVAKPLAHEALLRVEYSFEAVGIGPVPRAGRSWGRWKSLTLKASLLRGQAVAAAIRASILAQNPFMTKY
jgi:hypothetical protein